MTSNKSEQLSLDLRKHIGFQRAKSDYFGYTDIGGVSVIGNVATIKIHKSPSGDIDKQSAMLQELDMMNVDISEAKKIDSPDNRFLCVALPASTLENAFKINKNLGELAREEINNRLDKTDYNEKYVTGEDVPCLEVIFHSDATASVRLYHEPNSDVDPRYLKDALDGIVEPEQIRSAPAATTFSVDALDLLGSLGISPDRVPTQDKPGTPTPPLH